jgi:uncharacterized repeat protein (TIGR03843 family)
MAETGIIHLLQTGVLEVEGLLPWSSNYTFLVRVCEDEEEVEAVYKPRRGERPLWDFPHGSLCERERAAFVVSDALGWRVVPPTILREGPHGIGSLQLFVDHDPNRHYLTFEETPAYTNQLQKIVLLDVLINNADRKSGHVLLQKLAEPSARSGNGQTDRLWAIDHGVCFHEENKLRTVIWEFAGSPIPPDLTADLVQFQEELAAENGRLRTQLNTLLNSREITALRRRLKERIELGLFPHPGPGRHYPWPPV